MGIHIPFRQEYTAPFCQTDDGTVPVGDRPTRETCFHREASATYAGGADRKDF